MSWTEVIQLVDILVWPLVVLALASGFNKEISGLIGRIKSLSVAGNEIILNQKVPTKDVPEEISETADARERDLKSNKKVENSPSPKELQKQIESLLSTVAKLQVALNFERIYQNIYGSQIVLLEELRKVGAKGVSYTDIASYYEQIRNQWPVLKKYQLDSYIGYLVDVGLVEQKNLNNSSKIFYIKDAGVDFLEYVEELGYIKNKNL